MASAFKSTASDTPPIASNRLSSVSPIAVSKSDLVVPRSAATSSIAFFIASSLESPASSLAAIASSMASLSILSGSSGNSSM